MGIVRPLLVCVVVSLLLSGCADPPSERPRTLFLGGAPKDLSASPEAVYVDETTTRNGTVVCSLAHRFFWFPDTVRPCVETGGLRLKIPPRTVRIVVALSWEPAQPSAENLTVAAVSDLESGSIEFDRVSGPSPLRMSLAGRAIDTYFADGRTLRLQVDAATGVLDHSFDVDVAAALAQDYTVTVTTTSERVD